MKYGFILPRGDARAAADLALEAEQAGWEGFFVWEPVWGVDAWVALSAAAMLTSRIRLGTMLTPLSRMRPWKLASETATLDNLSGGRVILAVGLGALDTGFAEFGETTSRRERAELLDEGLEILTGLWRGQPFNFSGKHYTVRETKFFPPPAPLQQPRIPIWVVGAWPSRKSMQRALRYDGFLPNMLENGQVRMGPPSPKELSEIAQWIAVKRAATTPFDIVIEGQTPGDDALRAQEIVRPYREAGATWWLEAMWEAEELEPVRRRLRSGPPHGI